MLTFPSATVTSNEAGIMYMPQQGIPLGTFPSAEGLWHTFDPNLMFSNFGQLGQVDPQLLASQSPTAAGGLQSPQMLLQAPTGGLYNPADMYLMNNQSIMNNYLVQYMNNPEIAQTSLPSVMPNEVPGSDTVLGDSAATNPVLHLGTALGGMNINPSGMPGTSDTSDLNIQSVSTDLSTTMNGEQQVNLTLSTEVSSVAAPLSISVAQSQSLPVVTTQSQETKKVSSAPDKPKSWAAVAKITPKPPPPKPVDTGQTLQKGSNGKSLQPSSYASLASAPASNKPTRKTHEKDTASGGLVLSIKTVPEIVKQLHDKYHYNPRDFSTNLTNARYFVIKSYAEDDIHRSIKYSIWTSTEHGNRRLDSAFKEQRNKNGNIYLFFSVNGSGHFCGMAQMTSEVDLHTITGIWAQDKWKGKFSVRWVYVKDVPNSQLRHIRLENNENKPVTNSRDTQEIPPDKGKQVVKIIHSYQATSSIFDDFEHYEQKLSEAKVNFLLKF